MTKRFVLALAAIVAAFVTLFAGVSPAAAVTDKNTLTKTCTISGTSTAWSVKLGLNGTAAGYQPQNVQTIGKSGTYSSVLLTGFTVFWYNSSGTLLQSISYAITPGYSSGTTWRLTGIEPSAYTTQGNYLWRVRLNSQGTNLCTTALST